MRARSSGRRHRARPPGRISERIAHRAGGLPSPSRIEGERHVHHLHHVWLELGKQEVNASVGSGVVVDDADHGGVADLVGDVPLAKEARTDAVHARELGVEDLERDPVTVAMCRRVDGRHSADAEERVEPVLGVYRRADARLQPRHDAVPPCHAPLSVREPRATLPVARLVQRPFRLVALLLLAVLQGVLFGGHAQALPPDPAARGLDVYVHAARTAAPGGILELTARAYGFPSVTHAVPLAGATLEIGWDPEELDGQAAPPSVHATTDSEGRARLVIEVPKGLPRALSLLVAVRHGGHARTRSVAVTRGATASVELHTADLRVVPTSTISAWVRVVGTAGEPLAGAGVVVSLLEGGVPRFSEKLHTDRGGLVMARVPIPRIDEPVWQWTLRAQADAPGVRPTDLVLRPREENPGTPVLETAWDEPASGVLPGDRVHFDIRIRDATGQPVIEHPVRYWIGPKGTTPPSTDKDWERLATRATTDGAGEVKGTRDAPTLVKSRGTSMILIARSTLEGHALERSSAVTVGAPSASAELTPEVPAIVPGLTQRMMLTMRDGHNRGIAGAFTLTADGLATTVTTNERGEAEITWNAPAGVGATRNVGPCAGGVAAAVVIRPARAIEVLRSQQEPFTLCLPVDRDAAGVVHVSPNVAKPGEKIRVTIASARGIPTGSHSVVLTSSDHQQAATTWLDARPDGTATGEIMVPANAAAGAWNVSVAQPDGSREARVLGAKILVVPAVVPLVTLKRLGGRPTPGGVIDFEAQLTDGHGHGLPGAVSAIVVDAFGGGTANVSALDTRSRLCTAIGVGSGDDQCTSILEREPSTEPLRRALLGHTNEHDRVIPVNDPGAHASTELEKAFSAVLHSLEGAVFEATKSPQTLVDARRKQNGRWVMNPELLTLVTDAMEPSPSTPGGEKLVLADLVAVDPQVTFDVVARRVTRLKLFTLLAAVRELRAQRSLDPDEPVFKDPNALLRRLVRDGTLTEDQLLDPWGGTIQYVRSNGPPPAPFLGTIHGFDLRAPGPDGLVGTGDDVRDPFERVVRSGSPYARAMQEDKIVDAKWDMVVSDATVSAWQQLFAELTGRELGASGLGLSGIGEGGGGRGEGIGLGSVGTLGHGGGSGRGSSGIASGNAYWSAPVRTDADGRVRISIPLGAAETTWRAAFVGVPDGLSPASTTTDIASDLPLSLRIDGGARWIEGDVVETSILVRNRTDAAIQGTVEATSDGAAALEGPASEPRKIDIPAHGARTLRVKVRAASAGEGRLVLVARAPGLPDDVLRHSWEIAPAGEPRVLTQTAWVSDARELGLALDNGYRLTGAPRLVLERGYDDAVAAALESLEPERQKSADALVDSLETSLRVQRWAHTRDTPRHRALEGIAGDSAARAQGRFNALLQLDDASRAPGSGGMWALRARAGLLTTTGPTLADPKNPEAMCPPSWADSKDEVASLDVEPAPGAAVPPCWGAYVADATRSLSEDSDPERIARALMALAERPHRAALAANLTDRLRRIVKLSSSGDIDGPRHGAAALADRGRRALIYAALLRTQHLGTSPTTADVLFGKLATLRDVSGGYGSSAATVAVVRALLSSQLGGHGATRAHVHVAASGKASALERDVDVSEAGFAVVELPPGTLDVSVRTVGPGLVARFERPVLRMWTRPPPPLESPVGLEVVWPADAAAGGSGTLRLTVRHVLEGSIEIDTKVPLPPGVSLGAATKGVTQVQGVLTVRQSIQRSGSVIEIPLRFGLAGRVTVPEATARITRSSSAPATAPARHLLVR